VPPVIVYITGFRQNAGKTVAALGIISQLRRIMDPSRIGYFKPVGQELVTLPDGNRIDKDAVIIKAFSGIPDLDLNAISPVRLASGFTREYLESQDQEGEHERLRDRIEATLDSLAGKDVVVAEGTGHPGVGGIVGLSNAKVSNLMKAEIVYLSGGGIGRALDQLEVDLSYFLYMRSRVRGIIFNKVFPEKLEMVRQYITEPLLNRHFDAVGGQIRILGFLPEIDSLGRPSMHQIARAWRHAKPLGGTEEEPWRVPVHDIKVLTTPDADLRRPSFLLPGDVLIMSSAYQRRARTLLRFSKRLREQFGRGLGGLILTGGSYVRLDNAVEVDIVHAGFPAIYVQEHTAIAEQKLLESFDSAKLQTYDANKVADIERLFEQHFDLQKFLETFHIKP
jgi:dethiobiotin synthetase